MRYNVYVRVEDVLYLLPGVSGEEGVTDDEAWDAVDSLSRMHAGFAALVKHEQSGETFYLAVPSASASKLMFIAKPITTK